MTEQTEDHAAVVNGRISIHEGSLEALPGAGADGRQSPAALQAMELPAIPARSHLAPGSLAVAPKRNAAPAPKSESFYSHRMQAGLAAAILLFLVLLWFIERRRNLGRRG